MRHNWVKAGRKGLRKGFSLLLAAALIAGSSSVAGAMQIKTVLAEERAATAITSMNYFSAGDGPVISHSGVGQASYGFVMPVFNGGAAKWADVVSDMAVNVKVDGVWKNIDTVSKFVYNSNWGNWSDGGFDGYWFTLSETTEIQLASKSNPAVVLNYTLEFTNLSTATITSLAATQGPNLTAGVTGGSGFTYPVFNGDASIQYAQVAADLKVFVWSNASSSWVDIDNNAASGWIYDKNFGQFTDGGGGYWFTVTETTKVRLASKSAPNVYLDYTIAYDQPVRTNYLLSSADATSYTADKSGAIGLPLPKIDGGFPYANEIGNFVYEINKGGQWVELSNFGQSGFSYQGNGYNDMSDSNQFGYWVDGIYGLWFQPIQEDMQIRIGYPMNGEKGGEIGTNYITYSFIGNPDAPRPEIGDLGNIELGTNDNADIQGWNMVFGDEFNGTSLNTTKWNYNPGYFINNDPNLWGWGNAELEYYTESERNIFLADGKLNLKAYYEPTTFPDVDPNRVAQYSSGKITSKDKLTFKYGRIDFSAKLPTGNGIWPALWMLPNEDKYGGWAASGELDVMEARGRTPNTVCGTLHYGNVSPNNKYTSKEYAFPDGGTFDDGFHVYSVVWEEDNIKWYVDGVCYQKITNEQWYSTGAPTNQNAPFDQEFYIIMNLAVGGYFDGLLTPDADDIPSTMQVEYVRVYQQEGSTNGSYTDNSSEGQTVAVSGVTLDVNQAEIEAGSQRTLVKTVLPANATNKAVTWTSSNHEAATVDQYGKVTAVAPGSTVITVTTADGGKSASCTVTVISGSSQPGGSITNVQGNEVYGLKRTDDTVEFYVKGASFADVHYKVNGSGQVNVAMTADGSGNYTYRISGLQIGDTIDYFFTFNPGQGAMDTPWTAFTLPAVSDSGSGTQEPGTVTDLAAGKSVTCSGSESDVYSAANLTDGNMNTRWGSNFADDAWFIIDLGKSCRISQVVLNWEAAYGKKYEILTSANGTDYTKVYSQNNSVGGTETLELSNVEARYVKFQGIERALPYGYSIWDVKVMGK